MIWLGFGKLLRFVCVMNHIPYSFYLVHSIFKAGNPTYMISLRNKMNIDLCSDIYTFTDWFIVVWYGDRDLKALHFDICLDDFDLHSSSQLRKKSKTSVSVFSQILASNFMKFSMLPWPVGLLKLMLNLVCTGNIQRRELLWNICLKLPCVRTVVNQIVSNLVWF